MKQALKPHWTFFSALRERGMTLTQLAAEARVNRAHLSEVIANRPGRGAQVRRKVAPLLTEQELLGWDAEGKVQEGTA